MWSLLVLNADAHNPHVKKKMRVHEWIKNTNLALEGVGFDSTNQESEGGALRESELSAMYHDVIEHPLQAQVDHHRATNRMVLDRITEKKSTGSSFSGFFEAVKSMFDVFKAPLPE
mmetsp:Transcript_31299/g.49031  ORF Transcript_31299/g.49031 Transcript_31299/m.49031 type:complete len:116 (-) Transcript_31299:189-536(-)